MSLRRAGAITLVLLLTGAAALASSQPRQGRGIFAPRWRVVSHGGVASDGSYTVLWSSRPGVVGTLIDERSGRRIRVLLRRGCRTPVGSILFLGDSWLLAGCSNTRLDLYSLVGRRWRSVRIASSCQRFNDPAGNCTPSAVGTDWIKYDQESYHVGDRFVFQNIASGAVRRDPTNAKTLPDLDSPVLARRICDPLRVPPRGTLALDGRFAVANGPSGIFLEQCGTKLHRLLSAVVDTANAPGSIMWLSGPNGRPHGIFLPSLQRFTVAPPPGAADLVDVELGIRHMYIVGLSRNDTNDVWSAAAPVP